MPFDPTGMEWWTFGDRTPETIELSVQIREVVDRLPKVQRAVVNAVFYERLKKRVVARQLGMYPLAVDRALERALRTIREELGEAL